MHVEFARPHVFGVTPDSLQFLVQGLQCLLMSQSVYKSIRQESDIVNLQQDLDARFAWSLRNEIYFQPAKCKNVRISSKRVSPPRTYILNGIDLEVVKSEKDLGVMIINDTLEGIHSYDCC